MVEAENGAGKLTMGEAGAEPGEEILGRDKAENVGSAEEILEGTERERPKRVMPVEVWSRVVGYFRPVKNWNFGKQQEFDDRKVYDAQKSLDGFKERKG